jgi:hypothetical protein
MALKASQVIIAQEDASRQFNMRVSGLHFHSPRIQDGYRSRLYSDGPYDLEREQMIFRLSQKISTKIKAGKLADSPLNANLYADWSCHLFNVARTQYILLMNTASFYSCLLPGKGITSAAAFVSQSKNGIGGFMADDGRQVIFSKYISPSFSEVQFAKPLNRSAIGSLNDHIQAAKILLAHGMAPNAIGLQLNETPFSALVGHEGKKYASPKSVFASLADRILGK